MSAETISFESEAKSGLVSIIIPTRNGERFISQSLESIARQTYTNWEVIIVEDGSQDKTGQRVREFARKHRWHRVDYSRNERSCGAAHTRNVAFRKARGEFVALLDVDDRWLPDHLQMATATLVASGKDIAYSSSIMIEDQTDLLLGVWGPTAHEIANLPHSLFGRSFVTPSATVMRRQVLADVGPWDTYLKYCEDFAFWLRCLGAGKTFQFSRQGHQIVLFTQRTDAAERLAAVGAEMCNVLDLRRVPVSVAPTVEASFHPASDVHEAPLKKRRIDSLTGEVRRRKKRPATSSRNGDARDEGHSDAA